MAPPATPTLPPGNEGRSGTSTVCCSCRRRWHLRWTRSGSPPSAPRLRHYPAKSEVHPEKAALMGVCRVLRARCQARHVRYWMWSCRPRDQRRKRFWPIAWLASFPGASATHLSSFARVGAGCSVLTRSCWTRTERSYLVAPRRGVPGHRWASGIGLEVMEHLARHAKARLVSVGRSPMLRNWPGIAGSRTTGRRTAHRAELGRCGHCGLLEPK